MSELKPYRCVSQSQIHIGASEPPEYVQPKEVLFWDGVGTVQRQSGEKVKIPNFRAMINAGWMVPADSEVQQMAPRAEGVELHEAAPRGPEGKRVTMPVVQDEERDLGSIGSVRQGANDGKVMPTHVASDASQKQPEVVRRKRFQVQREGGDDGVVVGRLKSAAKADTVEIGKGDQEIKRRIEGSKGVQVDKLMGSDLDSRRGQEVLLGNEEPESKFQNDGVSVSSGGSSIGGQEEGVVVGKIGQQAPAEPELKSIDDLRVWADENKGSVARMVKTLFRKYDAAYAQAAVVKEQQETGKATPPQAPDFEWDMNTHWKSREKLVRTEYKDELNTLLAIKDIETSKGVLKAVDEMIAGLEG